MHHVNTLAPTHFAPGRIRPNPQTGILPGDLVSNLDLDLELVSSEQRRADERRVGCIGFSVGLGIGIAVGVAGAFIWTRT